MFGRRRAIVNLIDDTVLRGTLSYSWFWGHVRLREVEVLHENGDATPRSGYVLIPNHAIMIVQVL